MFKGKAGYLLAVVGACCCLSLGAQAAPPEGERELTRPILQIRIFDVAGVSAGDLVRAEGHVDRIFGDAGIKVSWAQGNLDNPQSLTTDFSENSSRAGVCLSEGNRTEVRVQLLAHAPTGVSPGTLGFSLPCARLGIDSTIFVEQCESEAVSYKVGPTFSTVLGHAIAHEVGHVLLRSSQHSASGLMRARWDQAAWLNAALGRVQMDADEARRMRRELFRMEALSLTATGGK
jgi:hypothetical protein